MQSGDSLYNKSSADLKVVASVQEEPHQAGLLAVLQEMWLPCLATVPGYYAIRMANHGLAACNLKEKQEVFSFGCSDWQR